MADRGALANGIDQTRAADLIYLPMSPEAHHILTTERGWSADDYGRWLVTSWPRAPTSATSWIR